MNTYRVEVSGRVSQSELETTHEEVMSSMGIDIRISESTFFFKETFESARDSDAKAYFKLYLLWMSEVGAENLSGFLGRREDETCVVLERVS